MKERPLILASIGAAVAASLCCIGPLVAVALGLGAFGAAAAFEGIRPYLLGLTAALLAGSFYLVYRPAKAKECGPGACATESRARYARPLLWVSTALVVLLAAFPYYSGLAWKAVGGRPASASGLAAAGSAASSSSATVEIEGMTCGGCAAAVKAALAGLDGVREASVSFEDKHATVAFDRSRLTADQLVQAVEKAGYKAHVKP